jgi:hypothetical protein
MTIAKDTTGTLWIAFPLGSKVNVAHSLGNDTQWSAAFVVPVGTDTNVDADDIAGIIALPGAGEIGVFWSNQRTESDYFAVHTDGASPTDAASWQKEVVISGNTSADDHFNMKLASDGTLYVAMKTNRNSGTNIIIGLLVRSPAGTWSPLHSVGTNDFLPTRPLLVLDEAHRRLYVFYSPFHETIAYKSSDMDTISFPGGVGTPFIVSAATNDLNNPQSTKQNVAETGGRIEVISSSRADLTYFHNGFTP